VKPSKPWGSGSRQCRRRTLRIDRAVRECTEHSQAERGRKDMHRTQRLWAAVAVLAVLAFALARASPGAGKFGNSAHTKACKGTGYLNWLRSDGSALDSPAACHSYAVHGGGAEAQGNPGTVAGVALSAGLQQPPRELQHR
jgi:hypothetical protein